MLHIARTARPVLRLLAASRTLHTTPRMRSDPFPLPHTPQHLSGTDAPYSAGGPQDVEVDLSDPDLPFPKPLPRDGETLAALRARLVYQSRKRGTLEGDLLMSTFAREQMGGMGEGELREFDKVCMDGFWFVGGRLLFPFAVVDFWVLSHAYEKTLTAMRPQLLDENDWDTYYWATGKKTPPERWATSPLLEKLKVHARNEGKVARRMPDLELQRAQEL